MLSLEELQQEQGAPRPSPEIGAQVMTLPQLDATMMAMFRRADADGNGIVTLQEAMNGSGR